MASAFAARPDRFVRGTPQVSAVPTEVWINKPVKVPAMEEVAH